MDLTDPAAANGVPEASVAAAFEQHGRQVFRTAYRITGNVEDAEDVLQTVFLNTLRRGREHTTLGGRLGRTPGSYLARSAVNGALDVLRRRRGAVDSDTDALGEMPDTAAEGALQSVWQEELRARLRAALSTLSPNWAEIVALRYFEDLSNVEIAELLGTSASTVAVTLHRARARLRAVLTGPAHGDQADRNDPPDPRDRADPRVGRRRV